MAYCILSDITKRIPEEAVIQLTDDGDLGAVDQAVVDSAIADADELIDGYLRGRYALPLAPVPGILRTLSVDLVLYGLYGRKPAFGIPESVKDKYTAAIKILGEIQKGNINLGSANVEAPVASGGGASFTANERVTGRDKLKGF